MTAIKVQPQTLEQRRARYAWDCSVEGVARSGEEYRNLAKAAPALIMNNGLMQTLAFYKDKNKPPHQDLSRHLRVWIAKRPTKPESSPDFEQVMSILLKTDPAQYRQATDEALLILRWIRQFASAQ